MNNPSKVESVLLAALEKTTPEARAAYLDDACQDSPDLREQVDRLLAAHPKAVKFLELPEAEIGEMTDVYVPTVEKAGSILVGRYKLLEMIGEGGMGEVWVADQLEPIKRRVALKLIKPGMDSRSVLGRFEAERQALAVMDHPNIAKVLDAGTTTDGRPYFVMELVKGTPITEFCDARKFSPQQRLELFITVCRAIQHAHMKGIIHRDIKPSNVLVELHDEKAVVKVIDFGVAKAVGQQLTEKTIYTGFGALVGTPAYMAPEQATFNALDVDTRADVYALGVLLYELLAGSPPIEKERMKKAALDEVLRIVRDEEPPRPSARLSTSQSKASIAATRQFDPAKLSELMKGEIDWIVMKALEKERTRRYESANNFAADVQRYLNGEQVQAVPPSLGYRMRKAYRKNRTAVQIASAFALLVLTALGLTSWLAVKATRAESLAKRNSEAYYGAMIKADEARQQIETTVASQRIDADLSQPNSVLRLARTLQSLPLQTRRNYPLEGGGEIVLHDSPEFLAKQQQLREFIVAAVIGMTGNLLPPITHDGNKILRHELSADGKTLLTFGADATARLWDTRTAKALKVLRKDAETVFNCGLSPDGKTVFTIDRDSVVRFWNTNDATFRIETPLRDDSYLYPETLSQKGCVELSNLVNKVILSNRHALFSGTSVLDLKLEENGDRKDYTLGTPTGTTLWDCETGTKLALLDRTGHPLRNCEFSPDGRWVTAVEDDKEVVVFASENGKEIARLLHDNNIQKVLVSPTGKRIATRTITDDKTGILRIWDTGSWQLERKPISTPHFTPSTFLANDILGSGPNGEDVVGFVWYVFSLNQMKSIGFQFGGISPPLVKNHLVLQNGNTIFDSTTGQQLLENQRKFHPSLAEFAWDDRFIVTDSSSNFHINDVLTEKSFNKYSVAYFWDTSQQFEHIPGFGTITASNDNNGSNYGNANYVKLDIFPTASRLNISSDLLELWAQVAERGELGPDGEFVPWTELEWEKKQQELASHPAPYSDFPFPGYLATDKLHWLRAEFGAALWSNSERSELQTRALAEKLLRRAEEVGNTVEANRCRAWLKK